MDTTESKRGRKRAPEGFRAGVVRVYECLREPERSGERPGRWVLVITPWTKSKKDGAM